MLNKLNVLPPPFASQACTPGQFQVSGPLISISIVLDTNYCVPHPSHQGVNLVLGHWAGPALLAFYL